MYREIIIRTQFKDFHIVPTKENKITYELNSLSATVHGLDDVTPFMAYFHFKNREEYERFKAEHKASAMYTGRYTAERARESMVLRPPKEFKKVMKKQYSKWEFFNTAKLY